MLKRFVIDLMRSSAGYLLLVPGSVVAFLSLTPVFGYLPYSDRPGPGWFGAFPAVSMADFAAGVQFFVSWGILALPATAVLGVCLSLLVRLLELFRLPRLAIRIAGGLICGYASGYVVAATGWYIAIAAPPVYFAMLVGLAFGAFVLPKGAPTGEEG